ncbi:MAG: histidinol-phosphatase HisJ family protein [Oscillospiraceae bacterium]|jgi:histidinol-phosphatase (PHP family)|nr:histidinol-phosphatase HisJ family protein [Oscillospiraceae bacterium]
MYIDTHLHTIFSADGRATIDEYAEKCPSLGLSALCFTEHADMTAYSDPKSNSHDLFERGYAKFDGFREKYKDTVVLYRGVELGEPCHLPDVTNEFLRTHEFDFILCSLHELKGERDFYHTNYRGTDPVPHLDRYFDELIQVTEWNGFDSLAHITYPLRYILGREGIPLDLTRWSNSIDDVFRILIKNDKSLEVNASGLRMSYYNRTDPHLEMISRYFELGGRRVTLGSDAHEAWMLGTGLKDTAKKLRDIGFAEVTYYVKRRPVAIPIDEYIGE